MSNSRDYYPSVAGKDQKYATDNKNNQFYITEYKRDKDNNEIYETENGKQIYARNINGLPFYAKMSNLSEYYARDERNNETYIKIKHAEVYALSDRGEQFYATKTDGGQFYARNKHGRPIFVEIGKRQVYAKNASGDDIYPRNAQGKCIVAKENNIPFYAKANNGELIYPTDENNNEFLVNNSYITSSEGKVILPKNNSGFPIYQKDEDGNEKYLYDNSGYPVFGKTRWGEEVYAKKNTLDEFYPVFNGEPVFAKRDTINKYALNRHGFILYPERNNKLFYIEGSYEMLFNHFIDYIPGQYPKDDLGKEILVNYRYAATENDIYFYPKDEFLNEYTKKYFTIFLNDEYPVTNDGYVIIPNLDNEPIFLSTNENITNDNIIGLLYRSNQTYDFLTNVKTTKTVNTATIPYKKLLFSKYNPTIPIYLNRKVQYIVSALVFIIFILILALIS